jgi:predicted trehalose synthase
MVEGRFDALNNAMAAVQRAVVNMTIAENARDEKALAKADAAAHEAIADVVETSRELKEKTTEAHALAVVTDAPAAPAVPPRPALPPASMLIVRETAKTKN